MIDDVVVTNVLLLFMGVCLMVTGIVLYRVTMQRGRLWMLLDAIDTLDDVARRYESQDVFFREQARVIQKKRWAIWTPPPAWPLRRRQDA